MRMSKSLFLLMALAVGPVFAADGVVISRVIPGNLSENSSDANTTARATTSRTTIGRTTPVAAGRGGNSESGGANRTVASRTTATGATASRATTRPGTVSSRGTVQRTATNTTGTTKTRAMGDINSNPAVRRAGVVLRPSFADFGGRATISGTNKQTGSNIASDIQKVTGRAAKQTQATKESIAEAKEKLEQTAELNKSCQEQYNECMDQFCAVVDANQKRCSCSANLSRYTKVEKAVTDANAKLNEVAQAIRYVGLSADEIRAIMTETEAEEALDDTKDTSTTRNMLKQIEAMIKDPTSKSYTYSADESFGLDMDLTFSSEPLDIFSLDFLNLGSNSASSISNMRGTELYNTAKRRCSNILSQCKDAGATQTQITGNYDLAIDKDCVAYENGLKKMNETLLSNVRSANLMLQKARLAVLQNKNQYDAKGCVAALDACMRDDMVCGDNYYKCVDPTKARIDENGEVVLGQDITIIQSFMTEYNNADINAEFISDAYKNQKISPNDCGGDGKCIVKYLVQKIGTQQKSTDEGLCRPVLDKCQYYTYKDDKYQPYNDIVVNYIQRAMVNIRAAQQKIISEYASTCITDVATCYNSQVTQVNAWAASANVTNVYSVMRGACRNVALTCGFALFTGEPTIEKYTPLQIGDKTYHVDDCKHITSDMTYGSADYNNGLINCVSDMFYQSLLCPDNSTYKQTPGIPGSNGYVNTQCVCNDGYQIEANACVQIPTSNGGGGIGGGTPTGGHEPVQTTRTITYDCNGGNGSVAKQTCNVGETVTLADVNDCGTNNGSSPIGWDNNNPKTYACLGNKTFKAQWPSIGGGAASYTVTYNCGDGTGQAPDAHTNISAGSSVTLRDNTCDAPDDKQFDMWSCGGAGNSYTVNRDVTCTAQWRNQDESSFKWWCSADDPYPYIENFGKPGDTFWAPNQGSCQGKNGATFQKWQCSDGKSYESGDPFTYGNTNVNCTPVWSGDAYINYVWFDCNGGTGRADPLSTADGGSVTLPQGTACKRQGYTFAGWKCGDATYDGGDTYTPSSNTTCSAQWQSVSANGYTLVPTDDGISLLYKNSDFIAITSNDIDVNSLSD